ncbi:MAG: hypothetical protein GYB68_07775 [Chloroflexi bacterium]|nr:hypothetical protein [Chloroflexota bacterium]
MADARQSSGFGKYPLEQVALGLLVRGPKHGYGLYQDFVTLFDSIWKAGQTKFYGLLTSLEQDKLLSFEVEPQDGRPARKVYRLTTQGREQFMTWVYQPVDSIRGVRVEFIAKLRFFNILDLPDADHLINAQLAVFEEILAEWRDPSQTLEEQTGDHFYHVVDAYRLGQVQFIINWLRECHADLTRM